MVFAATAMHLWLFSSDRMLSLGAFDVLSLLEDSDLLCLDWWSGGSVIAFKFESLS